MDREEGEGKEGLREKSQLYLKIRQRLYAWSRCPGNIKEKEIACEAMKTQ